MAPTLIIGIGNPDQEYVNTRHNVGFMALDFLARKAKAGAFEPDKRLDAQVTEAKIPLPDGKAIKTVLIKPLSYVNATGAVATKARLRFKARPENIIVIQDDLDIPFGRTKLSFDKNSGGHRGIESITKALKTKKFYRIRIGTAKPALDKARAQSDKKRDEFVRDFVLSTFTPAEYDKLNDIFKEVLEKLTTNILR